MSYLPPPFGGDFSIKLKNVLFAGITKATEQLEQKLNKTPEARESQEAVSFISQTSQPQVSSQLFPSAGENQPNVNEKPRSILKQKTGGMGDVSSLEQTLQMLRGKPSIQPPSYPKAENISTKQLL